MILSTAQKKGVIISVIGIVITIFLFRNRFVKQTPKKFLNHTKVSKKEYSRDSGLLVQTLRPFLADREGFNLNDNRFWNSSIWDQMKEKEMKKKMFEQEKKLHPENVYEPK
jgi:hypothetical protein